MTKTTGKSKLLFSFWMTHEINLLAEMWRDRVTAVYGDGPLPAGYKTQVIAEVAAALGRTRKGVRVRIERQGTAFVEVEQSEPVARGAAACAVRDRPLDPRVAAARDARAFASTGRSLTACILGDPPPGYSALDQKRAEASAAP